jgi:pimeloyl-ACP methyl ester carboxylesterase
LKLVLLPGLDGTGNLFGPLLRSLSGFDCKIIALPETGDQDYPSITQSILKCLPEENFILIAESFSGPIGAALANECIKNLKGIIFVATFLSAPRKMLLGLARHLPLTYLSLLPLTSYFYKKWFLGSDASRELTDLFQSTVRALPTNLIKARLNSIYALDGSTGSCDLPAMYVKASLDKLVPESKISEFRYRFKHIIVKTVDGPHFILQANPIACAEAISEFITLQGKAAA